jgi:hypothetical protein
MTMRIFSLLLSVALSVGCGGTVVEQQVEAQPLAPPQKQTPAAESPKPAVKSPSIST